MGAKAKRPMKPRRSPRNTPATSRAMGLRAAGQLRPNEDGGMSGDSTQGAGPQQDQLPRGMLRVLGRDQVREDQPRTDATPRAAMVKG